MSRFKRIKADKKQLIALALVIVLIVWLISGTLRSARDEAPQPNEEQASEEVTRVQAQWFTATSYQPQLPVQGQLEPWQQVSLRARVAGEVLSLQQAEGSEVEAGEVLLRIEAEDKTARLEQLLADQEVAAAELAAAQRLQQDNLIAQTERLRLSAELARVEAELKMAQLQLEYTEPKAPFNGIFDRRLIDPGEYVDIGQELLIFADVSQLRVSASIPQQRINEVHRGQQVQVELLDGTRLEGEVIHTSRIADPQTRSFHIEVKVANDAKAAAAGASANLRIALDATDAHQIPPSLLRLDGDGRTTVRLLDDQHQVAERTVEILSMGRESLWVKGLPTRALLITQGAGFVEPGDKVDAQIVDNE
ncbi:efflux RND transporter periplasmic adaptor subunit [Aliidiomarina soli]|uniref:efflux RND transporter periplasmic adaptor subunit n=1 Tax=Aliidiomarina soli TaxID=1928574 RepID=UPI0013001760|nr:efflux RND transporter periplasmic adaptor subunit [Aliidiomarina soli]